MAFNNIIDRSKVAETLVPEQYVKEIIQDTPKASVVLTRAKQVRMSSKVSKQPVLATLPEAYWLNGDTDLKQTTEATWSDVTITAEEMAVLVPIPDAVIDDASIDLFAAVKPLIAEAIGRKLDQAALFGVDKPASFPTALVPGAIAAGNTVEKTDDLAADVAKLGGLIAADGFALNGFASKPGLTWELVGLRNAQGTPIYTPSLAQGAPSTLYGYPLNEANNGAWNAEAAELLAADWSKVVVGIRQDITFKLFDQMIINDAAGKVIFNAAQQDSKVLRVVFRVGFQVANPLTRINTDGASRYPAGVVVPAAG